jgi:hypothetical protein
VRVRQMFTSGAVTLAKDAVQQAGNKLAGDGV